MEVVFGLAVGISFIKVYLVVVVIDEYLVC